MRSIRHDNPWHPLGNTSNQDASNRLRIKREMTVRKLLRRKAYGNFNLKWWTGVRQTGRANAVR
jgi:hypothetical protein